MREKDSARIVLSPSLLENEAEIGRIAPGPSALVKEEDILSYPPDHRLQTHAALEIGEDRWAFPFRIRVGVPFHHGQIGADQGREVDLVDDEEARSGDPRSSLPGDLVPPGHVDDVDPAVHELGAEACRQIVAAAFDEEYVEVGESLDKGAYRFLVERRVLPYRGMGTSSGLYAH